MEGGKYFDLKYKSLTWEFFIKTLTNLFFNRFFAPQSFFVSYLRIKGRKGRRARLDKMTPINESSFYDIRSVLCVYVRVINIACKMKLVCPWPCC